MSPSGPEAGSAGAILKAAREARGLTPEQAAEQLRLSRTDVLALEADRFEQFGAPVFARGHLRKYALLVGADAERVLDLHAQHAGGAAETSLLPPATANKPVRREPRWIRPLLTLSVLLLVVAAAAAAGWWAWYRQQSAPERSGEAPLPAPFQDPGIPAVAADGTAGGAAPAVPGEEAAGEIAPLAAPAGAPEPPPGAAAPAAAGPLASTTASPVPAGAPSSATTVAVAGLSLDFSGPCWLEVYGPEGRALAYGLAEAGNTRRFAGPGPWRIVLGNATVVRIRVGGSEVAVPRGFVVRNTASLQVDAAGNVERLPLRSP